MLLLYTHETCNVDYIAEFSDLITGIDYITVVPAFEVVKGSHVAVI